MNVDTVARGMGWSSLALGATELLATGRLRRALGAGDPALIRAYGIREIVSGLVIVTGLSPRLGVLARVAGDAIDVASLLPTIRRPGANRGVIAGTIGSIAGITALDVWTARRLGGAKSDGPLTVSRSIPIDRPADELQRLWSDPETMPKLMAGVGRVDVTADGTQKWQVRSGRHEMHWDMQPSIIEPGTRIVQETPDGSSPHVRTELTFLPAPADWGTETTLTITVTPPNGPVGMKGGRMRHLAGQLAASQLLRRFKSLAETGEVPTLVGQPAARDGGRDLA